MSRLTKVMFQLDYFMSSQFAGVAVAMRKGLYAKAGVDLQLLPTCPPGMEAQVVSEGFRKDKGASLWVGCSEQNTMLPPLTYGFGVKAVAAMFGKSPLCIAGLPGSNLRAKVAAGERLRIAAHDDTVGLIQRIVPNCEVRGLSRPDKLSFLKSGEVDAVQAYDVMENLKIERETGKEAEVLMLESDAFPGVALGYGQVIFAPDEALQDAAHHEALKGFLNATFEGWGEAIKDPKEASKVVLDTQEECEHWVSDEKFCEESVRRCCDYVKLTEQAGMLGQIDPKRWEQATEWLTRPARESLDASVRV